MHVFNPLAVLDLKKKNQRTHIRHEMHTCAILTKEDGFGRIVWYTCLDTHARQQEITKQILTKYNPMYRK
jgi:hypothetical protein